jgi:hypothetical protein
VGGDLYNLLNLPLADLLQLYPAEKKSTLKGKKHYWKTKLLEGKITMPPKPESQPNPERETYREEIVDGQLVSEIEGWYEMVTKNAEGEAEVHRLYKHSTKKRPTASSLPVQPVEAAIIRPSRRKPPTRNYEGLFIFSDSQIGYRRINGELEPIHHEPSIRAAQLLCLDLQPDYLIDAGDTTDFAEISRFGVDSDHFQGTLQPSLQRTHDMFAEFTAASPNAKGRYSVWSNHIKRLSDFLIKSVGAEVAMVRPVGEEHPAMSFQSLVKLKEVGWDWIEGYGNEYNHLGLDELSIIHGEFAVSNGSTAAKLSKANYGRHIIQGHKHSIETHYSTDRQGNQWGAFVVGALCRRDGYVPSYHSSITNGNTPTKKYENWQNGVMFVRHYGDGNYQFDQIPIRDGRITYNGKEYDGNE